MNIIKNKFSTIILVISCLLLLYTFYKSEILWNGSKRDYYLIYYFISLILIFFSIFTFFINEKIKGYLIILSISLVITLYLFEGYLTFTKQPLNQQNLKDQYLKQKLYKKITGNKWDNRSRIQIYNDLKKVNDEIVISVSPFNYINRKHLIFPLSGISNSETIHCNENGYYSIYKSDRYGFNNPDYEWDKKEIEYLLIGDSFTHGSCVNRPNDISSVLRNLSNKSVLNLGMSGNEPLIEYATLREYLNTNIKKVLWIYYEGNDLVGIENEKKNNTLINYLNDLNFTQNLKLKKNETDILSRQIINEKSQFNFIYFLKLSETRTILNNLPKGQKQSKSTIHDINEFKKIILLAKKLVEKNNSKLYFVYLPEYSRYKTKYDNTYYSLIKNFVTELNITFIDIHNEIFKKEKNPLKFFPFEMLGHYNIEGYKKVAESIFKLSKE